MEKVMFKAWVKAQTTKQTVRNKLSAAKEAFCEESGEGAGIIVAIILIVIAVALAIIFRDWISSFVAGLFGQVDKDAQFGDLKDASEAAKNGVGTGNSGSAEAGSAAALFAILF